MAATQPIINAEAHEVAAAVGVVVLCGTLAMFIYPFLFGAVGSLAASPRLMGIYTGATVHELAGVVAAGNAMGAEVANTAIITKLLRVFLLEPWIIALYYLGIGQKTKGSASDPKAGKGVPWFAFGFIGVATVNSVRSILYLPVNRMGTSKGLLSPMDVTNEKALSIILDADIIFNAKNYQFSTDLSPGTFDVQGIATHEVGHLIGLDHSLWTSSCYRAGTSLSSRRAS